MRRLVLLVAGLLCPAILTAGLNEDWVGTHRGSCVWTTDDFGQRVACDADGNVYVCWGGEGPAGSADYITVKYSSDGTTCWTRYYDGPDHGSDEANAIAVDASGAVYVTGFCTKSVFDCDYATIKYDSDGHQLWVSYYDGGHGDDVARAIVVSGAAVYVTGHSAGSGTDMDYATLKYNTSDGGAGWASAARYDGGYGSDYANAIAVDASGAVYVTGNSTGPDWMDDYATVKYSSDGTLGWQSLPGGAARYDGGYGSDIASGIAVDAWGAVYVTGTVTGSVENDHDWATIKYNPSTGEAIRSLRYERGGNAFASAIAADASGAVYVTGFSTGEYTDYTTIKYNADGSEGWASPARYDGPAHLYDDAYAIAVNSSGVYVTGFSNGSDASEDYATVWYDASNGTELGTARYAGPNGSYDISLSIASGPAGHVYVTGYSIDYGQFENIVTIGYYGEQQPGKPAAFNLSSPADDATGMPIEGDLTWEASTGAERYEVSLGGIVYQAPTNSCHYSGLSYSTEYAWNVTAFNDDGNTVSSNGPFGFTTIIEKPTAFDMASPTDGAENQSISGTLTWNAADRATGYDVYFGTVNPPTTKVGDNQSGTTLDYTSYVVYGQTYYWKIVARNAAGETPSNGPFGFTTIIEKPAAFNLASPDSAAIDVPIASSLVWNKSARTVSYDVYRGTAPNSLSLVSEGKADTTCGYLGLANNQTYYWKVVAQNVGGSTESDTWSFTTIIAAPAAFDLASPANVATGVLTEGDLTWGASTGADHYEVSLGGIVYEAATNSYHYSGLSYNTDYAWNVTAHNDGGNTVSSNGPFSFRTGTVDAGVALIVYPSGVIDTLYEDPEATVYNYGTLTRSFDVRFEIRDSATNTVRYQQSVTVADLEGGSEYAAVFPRWDVTEQPEGRYYARCWTDLADDANPSNDEATGNFAVQAAPQRTPNWAQWNSVPAGGNPIREVGAGAASATDPQGLYVYLLKGNNTCEFYRYDPATETWSALDPIPERGRNNSPRTVKAGGTLAQVNGKFYATKGGNCLEYWEYNPAAVQGYRWTQKADVPAGAIGVHSGASAAGVKVGTSSYVYLLKASGTFEFYQYSVADNAWTAMATAPGQLGEEFAAGSSISYDETDTIFALKGSLNDFYAYVVSTNTWQIRTSLLLGSKGKQAKAGAAICYHLDKVYCIKGGNTQEFWVYNCDDNTWTQGSDVPLGADRTRVQDGGTLVYCRDSRYLFGTKGKSLEFWSYGRLLNYGQQSPDGVVSLQTPGVNTYGLVTASALVPGRDRVAFALPRPGNVSLKLYDMTGRVARVLVNGWHEAGRHEVGLGAANLAQGAYILRYATGDFLESRKLVVQR